MKHTVTLIRGDGIGPEITKAMQTVVESTGVGINWEIAFAGQSALDEGFELALPQATLNSIKKNKVAIKGPTGTPIGGGFKSANVDIRVALDLFANIRPVRTYEGVFNRYPGLRINTVIFREATEDIYNGTEKEIGDREAVEVTGRISRKRSEELFQLAFDYAIQNGYKKITVGHKGNILKDFYGIFLEAGRRIADTYQTRVSYDELIIDNLCGQMIRDPKQFGVVVVPNMFGDILSDVTAEITGGLGLAPGANIGHDYAVFEAVHGTAPTIAGQNKANPTAMILSGAMMLEHLGEQTATRQIKGAVAKVLAEQMFVTSDIQKEYPVSTELMAQVIAHEVPKIRAGMR